MIISTNLKIRGAYFIAAIVNVVRKIAHLSNQANVNRRGINWSLDLREGIDFAIYLTGAFEPNTIASYKQLLNPGDVAIDIGANIGAHTLHLAEAVGSSGQVLAVEPATEIFLKLKENLRQNPNLVDRVHAFQVMLMVEDSMEFPKEIYARWPLKGSPKAHPLHGGVAVSTEGAIIKSLDSMLDEIDIKQVNLIKLDVDGYELDVLLGAAETIRRYKPAIIFEHSPYTSEERNIAPNSIINFLKSMDYSFFDLSGRPIKGTKGDLPDIKAGSGINILAQSHSNKP